MLQLEDLVSTNYFVWVNTEPDELKHALEEIITKHPDLKALVVSPEHFATIRKYGENLSAKIGISFENDLTKLKKGILASFGEFPIYVSNLVKDKDPFEPNIVYKLVS